MDQNFAFLCYATKCNTFRLNYLEILLVLRFINQTHPLLIQVTLRAIVHDWDIRRSFEFRRYQSTFHPPEMLKY
jgi:hypothetical protein